MGLRFRFRFRLGLTLSALVALTILVSLGTWQVQRLEWKQGLIDQIAMRAAMSPAPLPSLSDLPANVDERRAAYDFMPVTVTGRFAHDREILMAGISAEGQGGYMELTPLETPVGDWVLVNRGFVPPAYKDAATRLDGLTDRLVTVSGLLQSPPRTGPFTPLNIPESGQWYHLDLAVMGDHAGVSLYPLVLVADKTGDGEGRWPVGGQAQINLPNNHLGYIITWYGLALALVGVWLAMSVERRPNAAGRSD